ncbi:MAG: hypothetical protein A2030_11290 [Chloroflexi bacterium RBG_19FT_COMBO_50_10]|nr:MAG: hypothetical protein A2030_11290 [Chloroflexi bacterium RBG_19FT_COMBO_50_10]
MISKRIIHIVFVVTLVLVSGFAVTPASAKAPVQFEEPIDASYSFSDACGFPIDSHYYGTLRSTIWLDENGLPYKAHQNWNITEIWGAGGNTLEFKYNYPARAWMEPAYPDGYVVYLGTIMITLPGEGVVYSATGLLSYSFTIDELGNVILLDLLKQVGNWETDWAPICEYLVP